MKATFSGKTIADSDETILIESNHYFPPDSVNMDYLKDGDREYTCPWKGEAKYWDVVVGEHALPNAAWSYSEPKKSAIKIVGKDFSGYIAFHNWVEVSE